MDIKQKNICIGAFNQNERETPSKGFDQCMMQHFIEVFNNQHKKDTMKLNREAGKAQLALSPMHQARIEIEALYDLVDLSVTLNRMRFEEINNDHVSNTRGPVNQVTQDSGPQKTQIDEIAFVGGSKLTRSSS